MSIDRVVHFEVMAFLYSLAVIIAFQLLTRRINMSGLLNRKDGSGDVSPERVQLLIATLVLSMQYLKEVAQSTTTTALPDVGSGWLYLMGGSSGIYAAGKLY